MAPKIFREIFPGEGGGMHKNFWAGKCAALTPETPMPPGGCADSPLSALAQHDAVCSGKLLHVA